MRRWLIGETHPDYGLVCAMAALDGEEYRFFVNFDRSVAMIPLVVLNEQEPGVCIADHASPSP